jgi:hypothetical protein
MATHGVCLDDIPVLVDQRLDDDSSGDVRLASQRGIFRIDGKRLTRRLEQGTSAYDSLCWLRLRRRRRSCPPCAAEHTAGKPSDLSPNYSPGNATDSAAQVRWGCDAGVFPARPSSEWSLE